jgi:hypothetical protein
LRRIAILACLSVALLPQTAIAQSFQGNWACRADDAKTGILTIYGDSYGFASTTYGDKASGVGSITGYTDGVAFNDGPLVAERGMQAGRIIPSELTGIAMQLETGTEIAMVCTVR